MTIRTTIVAPSGQFQRALACVSNFRGGLFGFSPRPRRYHAVVTVFDAPFQGKKYIAETWGDPHGNVTCRITAEDKPPQHTAKPGDDFPWEQYGTQP